MRDTKILVSEDSLEAKGKGDVLSVDINCHIVDGDGNKVEENVKWKVDSYPEWISVTYNPTKIVLEVATTQSEKMPYAGKWIFQHFILRHSVFKQKNISIDLA